MGVLTHLARRGLQHESTKNVVKRAAVYINGERYPDFDVPTWGVALITVTAIVFLVFVCSIEYTLERVIAPLAMVETTTSSITISASDASSAPASQKEGLLGLDTESAPTKTTIRPKPITSSIRTTVRHLVSQAGRLSRWRGLHYDIFHAGLFTVTAGVLEGLVPQFFGYEMVIAAATGALLAPIHAVWTHKVISMPSDKTFKQRVMGRQAWKALLLPAVVRQSAVYAAIYVSELAVIIFGLTDRANDNFVDYKGKDWSVVSLQSFGVLAIFCVSVLFIVLPAIVTLIRVEASLLPEDEDTIVPFDRSFNGKVVPQVLGGTGAVGFVEAWRSFNWEARRRLLKLYAKITLIMTAIMFVMVHVLAFETWAVMGPAINKWLVQVKEQGLIEGF
ncbi:hypothetical protein GQ43DRAFT_404732 [Delitschia confertaspora ATCC 74209]|uniref:Uncharacterized protein n=1 Tax=Delitschia confertaspora ATCC 74209 TaxID=1513339 RepID=A0A9P4MN46_9PLEO|nr:hypothetical protein GQ43DRAFT_404732 [Delitschia confertaspora ATCC 74209]